ncbi:MAG: hypothetical protein OHK93_004495 [Ramalina farinacea]|uniref:Protein kinase domain-containing protein n=1 Tax=Ramalina farinacea TaxID=258253 RepID=A0AA43QXF9_9LECA|nr:hypothetical protein [Ramalina farinacea]
MSALQNEALPTPEQTIQASLILLEAEIGQRTSAVSKLPASLVGGDVATEARDVLINGNMWEWRKTFHLKLPASSQIDKPICVLTIGSGLECNIALQSDEILAVHCRVYAQLNSNFDCWILENLSETVIQYSDDDRYFSEFNALIPSEEVCLEHLSQGRIALHRLRGLVVGPFKLNLRVPSGKQETKQRASWFRLNLPGLVSKEMLREQTQGRDLHRADFEVIRLVGRGGFGRVEEVMERKSGLRLAMKSQVVEVGPTMDQVRNEIYNMENLRHEFIVEILARKLYQQDQTINAFIWMPLYQMSSEAALDLPDFTIALKDQVMFQVTCGLQYMHDQDMLHRDLKPENILIASMNPVRAVLADLGVSALVANEPYLTGTTTYWAPEYASSEIPTFASDIFALGLTFLKMIEHDLTDIADGVALRVSCMERPPTRWPVLIRQMTYELPGDRPHLQAIQEAIQSGQDLRSNEEFDRRNAPAPANLWSATSASFLRPYDSTVHTAPYGASNLSSQLQANEGQVESTFSTIRPSEGTAHGSPAVQKGPSNTKSLPHGNMTSHAPDESLAAPCRPILPRGSPRHRAPGNGYDVLRRVRSGKIAKPKRTSGSNPTSDTPRLQPARAGSWRAAELAKVELEKTGPKTV